MITKDVEVRYTVCVTIDETKFDEKFMTAFREDFYDFTSLDEHMEHIAQVATREPFTIEGSYFIEGYGESQGMGIKASVIDSYAEADA